MYSVNILSIATHLARTVGRLAPIKPARIGSIGGTVSFSFDDVPLTAVTDGAAILERYHARGTYYAALRLRGRDSPSGPLADAEALREASRRGHELGCHSFSHLACDRAAAAEIERDLERSDAAFAALLGAAPRSFAYPFGGHRRVARRIVAARYASGRGTSPGINHGIVDLAELRANRLYSHAFHLPAIRRLIDLACTRGGWAIFYGHDVAEAPSAYGCTPAQLEAVVAYARKAGAALLPVGDALAANLGAGSL